MKTNTPAKHDTTTETLIDVCENLAEMLRDSYRVGGMEGGKIENPEVVEEIAQLETIIARLKADRWIPVTESLPDADTEVLVYDGVYWLASLSNPVIGEADWITEENVRLDHVSHWRHLPDPPSPTAEREALKSTSSSNVHLPEPPSTQN
jgi:hypothetical protein